MLEKFINESTARTILKEPPSQAQEVICLPGILRDCSCTPWELMKFLNICILLSPIHISNNNISILVHNTNPLILGVPPHPTSQQTSSYYQ